MMSTVEIQDVPRTGDYQVLNSSESLWLRTKNQTIIDTAPVYKRFIGRHFNELYRYMKKKHSIIKIFQLERNV